jgi:hypothetical protein
LASAGHAGRRPGTRIRRSGCAFVHSADRPCATTWSLGDPHPIRAGKA